MKRFFNLIYLKFQNFNFKYITPVLSYKFNNTSPGTNNIKNRILNVCRGPSLIFIVCLLYYFIMDLTYYEFIGISIGFVYSFLIHIFVLDNFKYSNNIFVKLLQKFVMYNICIIIGIIIFYYCVDFKIISIN